MASASVSKSAPAKWHSVGRSAGGQILPDIATERFVIVSRLALAIGGLFAAWLDPDQPSQGDLGYVFLIAYVAFSLALLATFYRPLPEPWRILAHAVEIALVCLIIVFTEGPTSPFFIYFTFVLLVAALRWQWQGALITGALLSIVLILLTTSTFVVRFDRADIDRLIFRNIYLVVATVLFAFLGDRLGRSRQQLERLRLARELHDGILQTLTAVRLKLETAAAGIPDGQRGQLEEIGQLLHDEQRELRTFVEDSRKAGSGSKGSGSFRLSELKPFSNQLERLWGCKVDLNMRSPLINVQSDLGSALKFIIAESVANAVTHGGAKRVAVAIANDETAMLVHISDDGSGLPVAACARNDAEPGARDIGPRSIRERVADRQGEMRLASSDSGTELKIRLPIRDAA